MGKKKDLDFKKVKVKIGKKKPSNNVTKFNIKTAKIVIPGQNKKKTEEKSRKDNYFSLSEKELLDKLKCLNSNFSESITKKKDLMLKHKLDLTQSVWKTAFRPKWITPWDDLANSFYSKIGFLSSFIWILIKNGSSHKNLKVNSEAIRCLNLYIQLFGDTDEAVSASKEAILVLKKYLKSNEPKKKLLGLEVALALAKYCPFSFWYVARWNSAVFILGVLKDLYNNLNKCSGDFIDVEKFLELSAFVVASVIDGRRAGLVFIGKNSTQIQDFQNPPFTDLYYEDEENIRMENEIVTDEFDTWEPEAIETFRKFDLDKFFTEFAGLILGLGLKMLPIDEGCEKSLENVGNIVRILSRCCNVVERDSSWNDFCERLIERSFRSPVRKEADNMEIDSVAVTLAVDTRELSKKERKLRQKRLELEQRMLELCRNSKTVSNVKLVNKLREELNYHSVAMLYQCLATDKIDSVNPDWIKRLDRYLIETCDLMRNEMILDWLVLGRQIIQLPLATGSSSVVVRDLFVRFASDIFVKSHSASKIKRISLVIYVEACLSSLLSRQQLPVISEEVWNVFMDLLVSEPIDGLVSPHPTKPSVGIVHRDVTVIKAIYLLLLNQVPDAVDRFRCSSQSSRQFVKEAFVRLNANLRLADIPSAADLDSFRSRKLPDLLIWDYFSCDLVGGGNQQLVPLCSSIDDIFCQ